jgi:hypothetical protein
MQQVSEVSQMHRLILAAAAVGLVVLAASGPAAAGLGEAAALEHARMNALAGGPTNSCDADLLERYGCLSGTNSAICHAHAYRGHYKDFGRPQAF